MKIENVRFYKLIQIFSRIIDTNGKIFFCNRNKRINRKKWK